MSHFSNKTYRLLLLALSLSLTCSTAMGQAFVEGRLLLKDTRDPLVNITLTQEKTKATARTDGKGFFRITAPPDAVSRLRVKGLGLDTVVAVLQGAGPVTLELTPAPYSISEATVRGLTAAQVVKKAIARIPLNYPKVGLAYYGHYRQAHRLDSQYQNLIEARLVALVQPKTGGKYPEAQYDFALQSMRRQPYKSIVIEGFDQVDGPSEELFPQDPAYHLETSFLNLSGGCKYRFDTGVKDTLFYHIKSRCDFSGELHGCYNCLELYRGKEAYEECEFLIDRKSFAFVVIHKKAYKNPAYNYPKNNNFVLERREHYMDFIRSETSIQYVPTDLGWIPKKIAYSFATEFFRSMKLMGGREYTLAQFYEWQTDSVSRTVPQDLLPAFRKSLFLQTVQTDAALYDPAGMSRSRLFNLDTVYSQIGW